MSSKFTINALAGKLALCVIVNNYKGVINTFSTCRYLPVTGISCVMPVRLLSRRGGASICL